MRQEQKRLSGIWKRFSARVQRALRPAPSGEEETLTVLVIASGGARGVAALQPLIEIEDKTGKPIAECFDIISGISTGAIISAGLTIEDPQNPGRPLYSAKDLENFYLTYLPKIFDPEGFKRHRRYRSLIMDSTYDGIALEDALKLHFGDVTVNDALAITITPAADIRNNRPQWVTSLDTDIRGSIKLKDLARAVASAPTFLKTKRIEVRHPESPKSIERFDFVDGFFFSGMLSLYAYFLAQKLAPGKRVVMTFVGTGRLNFSFTSDSWNKLRVIDFVSDRHGHPILNMLTDMPTQAALQMLRGILDEDLFVFNKDIDPKNPKAGDPSYDLDDARPETLRKSQRFGRTFSEENRHEFDRLCEILATRTPPTGIPGIRRKNKVPAKPQAAKTHSAR